MRIVVLKKKRGNIAGLAKHLAHKHGGDPGFFTACMGDDELQGYADEARKGICAKAHKLAIGRWPGEDPDRKVKKQRKLTGRVRCCARLHKTNR